MDLHEEEVVLMTWSWTCAHEYCRGFGGLCLSAATFSVNQTHRQTARIRAQNGSNFMSAQRSHKLYRAKGRRNTQDEQKPSGRKRSERGRRGAREVGQGAPRRRRRHHSGRPQWGASYRRSFAHAPLHVSPVGYGMEGGWCLVQMWPLGVDANLHWL